MALEVGLSSAVAGALRSSQNIAALQARTQLRLATGRRFNSLLENPQAVSVSRSLSNRASDFLSVKNNIGQGISKASTAIKGLDSIAQTLQQLKAIAVQHAGSNSPTEQAALGDQFNVGASLIRAFTILGRTVDTTIHLAHSYTPDKETAQATDGTLLYSSFAWAPQNTSDIMYFNAFAAPDSYAPSARGSGGPLGITGLLFAGNGLAGAPISNKADHAYGGTLGYQKFFSLRQNLVIEIGGKIDNSPGGLNRVGAAVRYSQAVGRNVFFEVGGFALEQETNGTAYGLRTKLNFTF